MRRVLRTRGNYNFQPEILLQKICGIKILQYQEILFHFFYHFLCTAGLFIGTNKRYSGNAISLSINFYDFGLGIFIVNVNRSKMVRIYEYSALKTLPFNWVCNFFVLHIWKYKFHPVQNIRDIFYSGLKRKNELLLILETKVKYNIWQILIKKILKYWFKEFRQNSTYL